jgi:hypothetical protein
MLQVGIGRITRKTPKRRPLHRPSNPSSLSSRQPYLKRPVPSYSRSLASKRNNTKTINNKRMGKYTKNDKKRRSKVKGVRTSQTRWPKHERPPIQSARGRLQTNRQDVVPAGGIVWSKRREKLLQNKSGSSNSESQEALIDKLFATAPVVSCPSHVFARKAALDTSPQKIESKGWVEAEASRGIEKGVGRGVEGETVTSDHYLSTYDADRSTRVAEYSETRYSESQWEYYDEQVRARMMQHNTHVPEMFLQSARACRLGQPHSSSGTRRQRRGGSRAMQSNFYN